jgi:hypothetical protein
MTVGFGVLQMAVALVAVAMNPKQSVVELVLSIAGVTTGLVLGLFLLGSLLVRVSSTAAIAGFVVGAGSVAAVWIPGALGHVLLAWPWFAPLGAGSTVLTALAVNQLLRQNGPRQSGDRKP